MIVQIKWVNGLVIRIKTMKIAIISVLFSISVFYYFNIWGFLLGIKKNRVKIVRDICVWMYECVCVRDEGGFILLSGERVRIE